MRDLRKKAGSVLAFAVVLAAASPDGAGAQSTATGAATAEPSLEARIAEAVQTKRLVVFAAAIEGGKLVVTGVAPEPDQRVTLDGEYLTRSDERHYFEFARTYLPPDCIVKLTAGRRKAKAVVQYCGPEGPRGKVGPAGDRGARGASGPRGAGDVAGIHRFSGRIETIAGGPSAPAVFAGPTVDVMVGVGQRIFGTAQGALGLTGSKTGAGRVGLCYQSLPEGPVLDINGNDFLLVTFIPERQVYSGSGSVALPPGEYRLGFCVQNLGDAVLDDNDVAQGWVMVMNE
jgi:hypothetical protein